MNKVQSTVGGRILALLGLAAWMASVAGCRTIPQDALASFASGVSDTHAQAQDAFDTVNALIADSSVEYAANQPNLREDHFTAGLDEESMALWSTAFTRLGQYAQHIQTLTSASFTKPVDDQAVPLGQALQDFGHSLEKRGFIAQSPELTPSIAAGFTELGDLVIRMAAEAKARKIISGADKSARQLLLGMADVVGASRTNGLRGTAWVNLNQRMNEKKAEFLSVTEIKSRRRVAGDFRDLMLRRGAQDQLFASLRRSLLQLADLHHELAVGREWSARAAAAAIQDESKHVRDLQKRFQDALKPTSNP